MGSPSAVRVDFPSMPGGKCLGVNRDRRLPFPFPLLLDEFSSLRLVALSWASAWASLFSSRFNLASLGTEPRERGS